MLVHDGTYLDLFLHCTHPDGDSVGQWNCTASAKFVIKQKRKIYLGDSEKWQVVDGAMCEMDAHTFHHDSQDWGMRFVVRLDDLAVYNRNYIFGSEVSGALRVEMSVDAGRIFYGEGQR